MGLGTPPIIQNFLLFAGFDRICDCKVNYDHFATYFLEKLVDLINWVPERKDLESQIDFDDINEYTPLLNEAG